jgi:hypothetical protein
LTNRDNQQAPYKGIIGLDGLPGAFKGLNFLVTVSLGFVVAFRSWYSEIYSNSTIYDFIPFAWPLLFLLAWPLYAIPLWLRLTGLRWRWGFLAAGLVLIGYLFIAAVLRMIIV